MFNAPRRLSFIYSFAVVDPDAFCHRAFAPPRPGHSSRLWRAVFGATLIGVAGVAHAAPFANGDFEKPAVGTQFHEFDATRNAPTSWTPAGAGGCLFDMRWLRAYGNPDVAAASGWQFVGLQRGGQLGSISQALDTVPDQAYRADFELSAITYNPDGSDPSQAFTLEATAAGVVREFSITTAGTDFGGNGTGTEPWTLESFTFTATGASSTLTLVNLTPYSGNPDYGTAVDDVTVTPVATVPVNVPEPAPVLLVGASAACLLLARPRRRWPAMTTTND